MRVPIRIRLAAVYCVIFCASTVALEVGVYFGLGSAINAVIDHELRSRAGGVEEFLDEHVLRKTLTGLRTELASHTALQPDYLVIDDARGNRIFPVRDRAGITKALAAAQPSSIVTSSRLDSSGGTPLRILSVWRTVRGKKFLLHVGTDLSTPSEVLRRFRLLLILSAPIVLLFASAAGYLVSKSALKPVSELTATARSITAANLARRVVVPNSGDEVQALAETLNDMLVRIEAGFRRMALFTANASHELRTPIALMRTTSEVALLRANASAVTYREALHRILAESEKSSDLLDDMLHLARADSATHALALKPLDPLPGIEQVCEGIEPLMREKELRLEYKGPASGIQVAGNVDNLRRLWLILLDNAIKYTPGGGSIGICCRVEPERFVCEIRDTGIGIAEIDIPHIFERFYRSRSARNHDQSGAGLGLAIAHWIVDAHHGTIEAESATGNGSVFRVGLPLLSQASRNFLPALQNSTDLVNQ